MTQLRINRQEAQLLVINRTHGHCKNDCNGSILVQLNLENQPEMAVTEELKKRPVEMNTGALDDHERWYVVRTKLKEEDRADVNLRTSQVQTFVPKLKELRTSGYGGRYVTKALFSRYIFAHFDASRHLHKVNYTRGVQNVISFGGSAISVDDRIINLIKERVGEDGLIRMEEELNSGDKVRINSGPLANLVGIFERKVKDTDRVRLLLGAVSYQGHIEVEREMVRRA